MVVMSAVFSRLPFLRSQGVRSSAISAGGNVIAAGFSAVGTILVTRSLGPELFGEFSVGLAFLLLISKMNDAGMTVALHKYVGRRKDARYINDVFSATLKLKLIIVGSFAALSLVAVPTVTRLLNLDTSTILYAAVLCLPVVVLYEHMQAMLQSIHEFTASALFAVTQAVIKMTVAVVLYATAAQFVPLVFLVFTLAPIVPVVFARLYFPNWVKLRLFSSKNKQLHILKSTLTHATVGVFCIAIIEQLDILFVQFFLTTYETGILAGISKISLLITVMAYSIGSVLNPRVSRYQKVADMQVFIRKASIFSSGVLVLYLFTIPFHELLIRYSIGDAFLPGTQTLSVALAAAFLTLATVPFVATFFAYDKPWLFSLGGLLQAGIIVFGNLALVPMYGLLAAVWVRVLSQFAFLVVAAALSYYFLHQRSSRNSYT